MEGSNDFASTSLTSPRSTLPSLLLSTNPSTNSLRSRRMIGRSHLLNSWTFLNSRSSPSTRRPLLCPRLKHLPLDYKPSFPTSPLFEEQSSPSLPSSLILIPAQTSRASSSTSDTLSAKQPRFEQPKRSSRVWWGGRVSGGLF